MTLRRRSRAIGVFLATCIFAAGCSGKSPSILHARGSEASRIAGIWWLMFGLGAAVYAIVAFLAALIEARALPHSTSAGASATLGWLVWW